MLCVAFYKEKMEGFYVSSAKTDIQNDLKMDDVIVLEKPSAYYHKKLRQFGYEFNKNIKIIVLSWFEKI